MFQSFVFVPFMTKKNVPEFRIRTIYDKKKSQVRLRRHLSQKIKKKTHLPGVDPGHQQREPLDDLLTHRHGGQQQKQTSYGIFGHPAEEQITPTYTDDRESTLTTWISDGWFRKECTRFAL